MSTFFPRALVFVALAPALASAFAAPAAADYSVGSRTLSYTDPARGNRSVQVDLYYPADAPGEEVPFAAGDFPVLLFGHGYQMNADDYDYIWEGVVPAGYIVAFPRTEEVLFPDHLELGRDIAFLADRLRAANGEPGSPLEGHVDSSVAAGGHSMGGGASLLSLAENPSIDASVTLAAAETNPSAIAAVQGLTVPALLFAGSRDCVTPPADHQIPMFDSFGAGCKTYLNLTGASHCQFGEYDFLCGLGEIGCPSPLIDRAAQHDLVVGYLTLFLDAHLRADAAAWSAFTDLLDTAAGITWMQECVAVAVASAAPPARSGPEVRLLPNRPNPFNPATTIVFETAHAGEARLAVYDPAGRAVRVLAEGRVGAGIHEILWDGRDGRGRSAASGVYLVLLRTDGGSDARRIVLAR
ncbi:MAG: T9SS type A sorting domain-containing protein [Candidatus Eisenbacteria bacterium]|nr:T9SS type A sorting domain-containing protein [Candidatus Eisenbacteria bacterium]